MTVEDFPGRKPIKWMDLSQLDGKPVPDQEWAIHNRLPLRTVGLLSGQGAAGKSSIGLYACAAHVLAVDWYGSMPAPGPAFFVDAEDDEGVIHRRLDPILDHTGKSYADLHNGGLFVMPMAGEDCVLGAPDKNGIIRPTPFYATLMEHARDVLPRLIVLASSANVFGGNEIDRSQVQQFVGLLTKIALLCSGSVLLISHPSLTGIATKTGLSGSTQWHNAVRARMYLKAVVNGEDEQSTSDLRELEFKKNQYGPVQEKLTLRFSDGMFKLETGTKQADYEIAANEQQAENLFLFLLARFDDRGAPVSTRPTANNYAPKRFSEEPEAMAAKITKRHLTAAMNRLLDRKRLRAVPYGAPSRGWERIEVPTTPPPVPHA